MKTRIAFPILFVALVGLTWACEDSDNDNQDDDTAGEQQGPAPGDQPNQPANPGVPGATNPTPRPIQVALTQAALPTCDANSQGQAVFVQDQGSFQWCNAGNWGALDMRGEQGPAGPAGPQGPIGPAGAPGDSSGPGLVYDRNGVQLGKILFGTWQYVAVQMSDNSVIPIDWNNGEIECGDRGSIFDGRSSQGCTCSYTSADCTGTCYVNGRTYGSSVVRGLGGTFRLSGQEAGVSNLTVNSFYRPTFNDCGLTPSSLVTAYPASSYSLPDGLTLPFATPLRFTP